MRRPIFLIFTNAMILLVIFALLTQSLVIVQRLAVARNVVGPVEVQRGGRGEFRALAAREFVKSGDVIRTGKDASAEFKWADGTRWKLMPDSHLTVKKSVSNTVRRVEQSQLQLSSGKVFVRVVKDLTPESRFEVETPTAVARVRGTIFSVAVTKGQTRVQVWKGQVAVAQNGETQNFNANSTLIAPGQCLLADQTMHTAKDAGAEADFAAQTSIVQPELKAEISADEDDKWLVSGDTEAGNTVSINGEPIRVLGNGVFRKRLTLPANRRIHIVSRDKHGATATQTLFADNLAP